jgi:hypothetical protein
VKIGTSLALIAVGLILAYAVDFELPGIEVGTLGAILFFAGCSVSSSPSALEWPPAAGLARHGPASPAPAASSARARPPRHL